MLTCNFSNDSDCSDLFQGVHIASTLLQAFLASIILFTSIPANVILMCAMVHYHNTLDSSVFLDVSVLVSNTIVAIFFCGETVIVSLTRSWLLGYWGCQLIGVVITCGALSRWMTIGCVSLDRFCRVFLTFFYPKIEHKFIISLLVLSWTVSVVASVAMFFLNAIDFSVNIPGCVLVTHSYSMSYTDTLIASLIVMFFRVFTSVLPTVLYTALYCKGKKSNKVLPVVQPPLPVDNSGTSSKLEQMIKSKKTSLMYCLMILVFVAVNVLLLLEFVVETIFSYLYTPHAIAVPVLFLLTIMIESYVIWDLAIFITNRQQKDAIIKLLRKIFKLPAQQIGTAV